MQLRKHYFTPMRQKCKEEETVNKSDDRIYLHLPNIFGQAQQQHVIQPSLKLPHEQSPKSYQFLTLHQRVPKQLINKKKVRQQNYSPQLVDSLIIHTNTKQMGNLQYTVRTQTGVSNISQGKVNQDTYLVYGRSDFKIFGIYDGHGLNGHYVSSMLKENFPKYLNNSKVGSVESVIEAYELTNQRILKSQIDTSLSGSTGISVHVRDNELFCANVGDSRAILGRKQRGSYVPIKLNEEHKPVGAERDRIIKAGGRVDYSKDMYGRPRSPLRVWMLTKDYPGLAMTRCFGDKIGIKAGITADPEIVKMQLQQYDNFIIVGSDGLFEFLCDQDICNCISMYYPNNIERAADNLMVQALKSWSNVQQGRDDITFILIYIMH